MRLVFLSSVLTICIEKALFVSSFPVITNHRPSAPLSSQSVTQVSNDGTKLFASQIGEESAAKSAPVLNAEDKTLYEILNSTPEATRSELKRNYINLVRKTHPDALISRNTEDAEDENPEFQVIMNAWRTLSNPLERKRYDRALRAAAFTSRVENVVGTIGKTAGPQFLNAFENVAIPFLRRSAATTVAGFTSIGEDLANYGTAKEGNATDVEESGIGGIIANAVKSSQKAGKAIDCLELEEKSRKLKKSSKKEATKAQMMKDKLDDIMNERVKLTLHTPNAKLNSLEGLMILDGLNTLDEVKVTDVIRFRHTVSYEIEKLQEFESDLTSSQELNQNLKRDVGRKLSALEQAKANGRAAHQAEERARKALEDAKNLVASTNHDIQQSTLSLGITDDKLRYNELELERINAGITKQQERVRVALRRKEEAMQDASDEEKVYGDFKGESVEEKAEAIESLLKEERYLRAESARLENQSRRMASRAQKLEVTAEVMEKEEKIAWDALEESFRVAEKAAESEYGNKAP